MFFRMSLLVSATLLMGKSQSAERSRKIIAKTQWSYSDYFLLHLGIRIRISKRSGLLPRILMEA